MAIHLELLIKCRIRHADRNEAGQVDRGCGLYRILYSVLLHTKILACNPIRPSSGNTFTTRSILSLPRWHAMTLKGTVETGNSETLLEGAVTAVAESESLRTWLRVGAWESATCRSSRPEPTSAPRTSPHRLRKPVVLLPHQALRQDVSNLIYSRGVPKIQFFFVYLLFEKMVPDFDVLRTVMKLWIACDGNCGLVVHGEDGRFLKICFNSSSNHRSQMTSLAAWAAAMYSASVLERATALCFFDPQLMAPPASMKTKPNVDLRSFTSLPSRHRRIPSR
jgi:hypothetical protein